MKLNTRRGRYTETVFQFLCLLAIALPLVLLVLLLADVISDTHGRLTWDFLTSYPSRKAERAGILPGLVGSIYLISLTAAMALPIGIGAAVYLEEYDKRGKLAALIELNISNLAGVPSIIYGLLGLELFVRIIGLGSSLLAGACTMTLLVLPIMIMSSREALKTIPQSFREGAYALGATRWQTVRQVVLPLALPGILTGAILSISRAIGEAAPLLVVGALAYITFLPSGLDSPFTVLPIQIFNWVSRPNQSFLENAAAGIVVLMAAMLLLNSFAIILRNRLHKRRYW
ncbi:MAG: phosphate ABC transporter, permease protein PstA [Spirochaeta sp. LUC14_002_19_P3]|nr:MAG: phosphate ABC transporter, permease protein PstA [Spirochaeta sp. LUC14_002_19_P3]